MMIKMQKKLAEDSEISSLISSEDEHETALSSYYSSEKVESQVNIEQQSIDKAQFSSKY